MSDDMSRRDALRRLGLLLGAVAAPGGAMVSRPARAADLPHLSAQDPTARALAYHDDARTVDPKQFPSYKNGQRCSTCQQIQGQKGQPWRPCTLFPDALVSADGWCRAWTPGGGPD